MKFEVLNFTFLFRTMKKILCLVFCSLLVVGLGFWIAERWNVWFDEHPEPLFVIEESVVGVQLTVGRDAMNERIVSWRSRGDSALWAEEAVNLIWVSNVDTIYPKVNKRWVKSGGGEAIFYWSEVKVVEGIYTYAIATIDTITPYFLTEVDYSDSLSVVILGDVQDRCYNAETDSAVVRLKDVYEADFVLQLGDLIDRPHQDKWDLYFRSFESLRTEVPMIAIVGNHDYHKGLNKYPDERFFYTFPYFLDEEQNAPIVGCCELNFDESVIYVLDSNQPIGRLFRQRNWLKQRLVDANKKTKIVALHHPLRSARSVFNNLIVRWLFENLILENGVDMVLAGHEHTYHHLSADETGGYNQVITNFSFKNYETEKGDSGRKVVELKLSN